MSKCKINVKVKCQDKKVRKLKKLVKKLRRNSQEMSDELCSMVSDEKSQSREMRYLKDFISWKGLDDEYAVFREEAHEETGTGLPFPRLVM